MTASTSTRQGRRWIFGGSGDAGEEGSRQDVVGGDRREARCTGGRARPCGRGGGTWGLTRESAQHIIVAVYHAVDTPPDDLTPPMMTSLFYPTLYRGTRRPPPQLLLAPRIPVMRVSVLFACLALPLFSAAQVFRLFPPLLLHSLSLPSYSLRKYLLLRSCGGATS